MSFNLVDLIKNELGDAVLDQVTTLLGESKDNTENAVNAAISGILENLVSSSSKQGRSSSLASTLNSIDDDGLGNFASKLSDGDLSSLIEPGTNLLEPLLENGVLSKIAATIAEFSGIQSKSAHSLIGLVTPVILGVIRKKMGSDNLDANGLINMLESQQSNIAQANPVNTQSQPETISSQSNTDAGSIEPHQAPKIENSPSSGFRKVFLWVPLILLLCLVAFFLPKLSDQDSILDAIPSTNTASDIEANIANLETEQPSDYVNIGSDLGNIVNTVTDSLGSVTDVQSATSALPKITEATSKIDTLSEVFGNLPAPAKSTISSLAEGKITALEPIINRVVEIPAVGPVLKPALDSLMEKLAAFSAS